MTTLKINKKILSQLDNNFFKKEIINFSKKNIKWIHNIRQDILDAFVRSFFEIANVQDIFSITDDIFFKQIEIIKSKNAELVKTKRHSLIRIVIKFYVYLWEKFKFDFFGKSDKISIKLLYHSHLSIYLRKNYYFTKYFPNNIPYGKKNICLIVYNFDKLSTRFESEDVISIKIGQVPECYRNYLIEYIYQNKNNIMLCLDNLNDIIFSLNYLYKLKINPKYKNNDFFYFTTSEAMWIKQVIFQTNQSIYRLNNKLGWIRRFLLWLKISQKAIFENNFFILMGEYDTPNIATPKILSKEDITKINNEIIKRTSDGTIYRLYHVLFHLVLQTEFRISQLCHLKIDDIHTTLKQDEYVIYQNNKTSHGRKAYSPITKQTWLLLQEAIKETEHLRQKCQISSNKRYVFLKETKIGGVKRINLWEFTIFLKKISNSLGIQLCNSKLLRNTHMTLSDQFIKKQKLSDIELKVLSGHANTKTTNVHYIEASVQDMLEITLGVSIDKRTYNPVKNIVSNIEKNIKIASQEVEQSKGYCSQCHCTQQLITTCLICKNFHTTPDNIPFFEAEIMKLKTQKEKCKNNHDIEDVNTRIKLLATYLEKMYEMRTKND